MSPNLAKPCDGTPLLFQDIQSSLCLSLEGEQVYLRPLSMATKFRVIQKTNDWDPMCAVQGHTGRYLGRTKELNEIVVRQAKSEGFEQFRVVECSKSSTFVFLLVNSGGMKGKYLSFNADDNRVNLNPNYQWAARFRYVVDGHDEVKMEIPVVVPIAGGDQKMP